ncbi:hypothetical protein [Litorimonas haliclonae]|uniref:hypothetical protein n=1 Tax=Litorimonas haliclonae TaxID=2081977 RepID=UPI0039F066D2
MRNFLQSLLFGAMVALGGCSDARHEIARPVSPQNSEGEIKFLPLDYLVENYPHAIVEKLDSFAVIDDGPGYNTRYIKVNEASEGQTFLFCFKYESLTPTASVGIRFTFGDQKTTVVADPITMQAQLRGDRGLSGDAFMANGALCGEISSDTPLLLEALTAYPAIGPQESYPFFSADAEGAINISKYVIVVLP